MQCVICQDGETEPGTTTVALTRDDTTIVIRLQSADRAHFKMNATQ